MKCKFWAVLAFLFVVLSGIAAYAQQIQSMKLLSPQVGWATSGNHLYWTTDDGAHWKDITPPNRSKDVIGDTFFLDVNKGWVLLSGGDEEAEFELASTINGGSDWHITRVKFPKSPAGMAPLDGRGTIFFVDAEHGWLNLRAKGSSAFRLGILLMTEDGGRTWDWVPDGSDAGYGDIYFLTVKEGWIAGGPGDEHIYVTHDGAKNWQEAVLKPPPIIAKEYTATYVAPIFLDRKRGFLPVTYTDAASNDVEAVLVLFSSDDGGMTWKTDRVLPKRSYLSEGNVPVTVADSVLLIAPDSNNKGTLQLTAVPPGGEANTTVAHVSKGSVGVSKLSFVGSTRGWVSTSNELFSTQDGGVTWTNITPGKASRTGQPTQPSTPGTITPKIHGGVPARPGATTNVSAIVDTQLGFESCSAPSPASMSTWMQYSPYFDIGIYIGGVSRSCKNASLTSKWISKVEGYGWGIAPVWVGPQAPCACGPKSTKTTCVPFPHVFDWTPATASTEGAEEADLAATAMAGLGLSTSVVYLDIESYTSSINGSGQSCSAAVQAFLDGWVGEMHLDGFSQGAGVYGSSGNMQADFSQISPLPDEAWIAEYPLPTVAPSVSIWGLRHLCDRYSNPSCPSLWPTDQRIHQYLAGEDETWGKVKINIDADIIDAPVAHPTTGTKIYTYNFDAFTENGNEDYAYNINNVGIANPNYAGFINGSQSDIPGNIGQNLVLTELFDGPNLLDWSYFIYYGGSAVNPVPSTPPPYPQVGNCDASQKYYCTSMAGMNNAGWIVGTWTDLNSTNHGFLNKGGSLISFDAPGAIGTHAFAINDAGLVVGSYVDSSGNSHGFVYNANTLQFVSAPLDYPDGGGTALYSINGEGQILGGYTGGYFLYSNGNFNSVLANCEPGAWYISPRSVNDNGQIAGYYATQSGNYGYLDGFVSYDGGLTCDLLDYPTGSGVTQLFSINDAGQISGSWASPGYINAFVAVPQTP